MTEELQKLRLNPSSPDKSNPKSKGFKRLYFLERADLILELVEICGFKYPAIIEAIAKDGVTFSYDYFRELMAAEKKRRKESGISIAADKPAMPARQSRPAQSRVVSKNASQEQAAADKETLKKQMDAIKARSDINDAERRKLLQELSENYANNLNPLRNK